MIRFLLFLGILCPAICNAWKTDLKQLRIVNGTNAKINEFPFQASLQILGQHFCSGSIISHSWILTAAHCVYDISEDMLYKVSLVVGVTDLTKKDPYDESLSLQSIIVHPYYKGTNKINTVDIALLKLKQKIRYTNKIQPIALPGSYQIISGEVQISGWGSVHGGPINQRPSIDTSSILKKTTMVLIDISECRKIYARYVDLDSNVCAISATNNCSICHGDSGGPLSQGGLLVGIVSWGNLYCSPEYPAVFTRVAYFADYIRYFIATDV